MLQFMWFASCRQNILCECCVMVVMVLAADTGFQKNSIELNKLHGTACMRFIRKTKNYLLRRAMVQWFGHSAVQCSAARREEGRVRTKHKRHSISLAIFAFIGTPFFFTLRARTRFDVWHLFIYPPMFSMVRLLMAPI